MDSFGLPEFKQYWPNGYGSLPEGYIMLVPWARYCHIHVPSVNEKPPWSKIMYHQSWGEP
jgi:hypothetical protein